LLRSRKKGPRPIFRTVFVFERGRTSQGNKNKEPEEKGGGGGRVGEKSKSIDIFEPGKCQNPKGSLQDGNRTPAGNTMKKRTGGAMNPGVPVGSGTETNPFLGYKEIKDRPPPNQGGRKSQGRVGSKPPAKKRSQARPNHSGGKLRKNLGLLGKGRNP